MEASPHSLLQVTREIASKFKTYTKNFIQNSAETKDTYSQLDPMLKHTFNQALKVGSSTFISNIIKNLQIYSFLSIGPQMLEIGPENFFFDSWTSRLKTLESMEKLMDGFFLSKELLVNLKNEGIKNYENEILSTQEQFDKLFKDIVFKDEKDGKVSEDKLLKEDLVKRSEIEILIDEKLELQK